MTLEFQQQRVTLILVIRTIFLLIIYSLALSSSIHAEIVYYIDPTYTDTDSDANGSAANPWTDISSIWSSINTALESDNVKIYISARTVESDVAEDLSEGIYITNKTADPGFTLTINGNDYYNTNDSHNSGSWTSYSGSNRAQCDFVNAQNAAHTKYNNVTIQGLEIYRKTNGKAISIAGDDWTVDDCEVHHGSGVSGGPLVLLVPTADGAHEGSSNYSTQCDNITISNCTIFDSYGELVYLGGAGCSQTDSTGDTYCDGFPSHNNITISGNTLYNGGTRGGQGDAIDMKAGLTNVTITDNEIYSLNSDGNDFRGIVTQGQNSTGPNQGIIIEKNLFRDMDNGGDGVIAIVNSWGTPKGIDIRNNILQTVTSLAGIKVYNGTDLKIHSNTIYNCADLGLHVDSGTVEIKNNAFLHNNSNGSQVSWGGTVTSDYNAYSDTFGETCGGNCISGLTTSDFENVPSSFALDHNSSLVDVGESLVAFSDDYIGTPRPQGTAWDIGAYEYQEATQGSVTNRILHDVTGPNAVHDATGPDWVMQ